MIITGIIFIILGIFIKYGKMYFLIAGYNTLSKEKKKEYDIDGIASIFRNVMFGMACILFIGYFLAKYFNNSKIEIIFMIIAIIIGIPYLLIQTNSDKYKIK